MDGKKSKRTHYLQFASYLLRFHLQKHHVYWPGNMSCCVKSSVLRRLAERKGQKSMLIKGCGQLLACGFALIKAKCSCSQKTLQIYSSNSEHWLWVRPVGFVASRALTKKSHFLQSYEVCIYTHVSVSLCLRLCVSVYRLSLWPVCALGCFFPLTLSGTWHEAIHLQVMVLSHWCCALHSPWASPQHPDAFVVLPRTESNHP